jgi:hypothetical protein
MHEQRPYRTERGRAVRASILGAVLGLVLAMFARRKTGELAGKESADSGGHRTGDS